MIAHPDPIADDRARIPERVREFFRAGGLLEQACVHEPFAFEIRPQQMVMADAVAQAILTPGHLAVEAGTGVGKTFAYLAPLIFLALEKQEPVAVSTHTINLQEQIVFRDIPFLKKHLGVDFEAVLCKGRQNYLCRRRLDRARQMSGDLFHKAQERDLDRIRRWADVTEDGSLSDFTGEGEEQPASDVWSQVCSEQDNCLGRRCPHGARCFLMQARSRAFEADILILNHHLFFSDLALRQSGAGLLPGFKTLVLDEAHCLEATAGEHLGLRLSQAGIEHWLRRLYVPESGKGLLAALKESDLAHAVSRVWDDVERFFLEIKRWACLPGLRSPDREALRDGVGAGKDTRRVVGAPLDVPVALGERLTAVIHQIDRRGASLEDPDVKAELKSITRRGRELRDSLDVFLTQSQANQVYWIECEGVRRKQFVLYSAPIEVGPILETMLFPQFQSVILTSATLAVAGGRNPVISDQLSAVGERRTKDATSPRSGASGHLAPGADVEEQRTDNISPLSYFRKRVGAAHCRELVVGSPFDYSRQMRVYLAGDMPDPAKESAFVESAGGAISFFVRKSRGRAFVLFTSAEMMKTLAARLRSSLEAEGLMLIVQGEGTPRHRMLDAFKRNGSAVLFGLASFWMGVDVRGEALSNVIIVRLPFAVPDEPVTKARLDRIREQGGDPFRDYSLPEAILRFRQGVGRLIRTATDEGMIAVLDPRIVSRWYGRHFLNAIPECPVEIISVSGEP
ncbi:MAG: hypothetical protein KKE37_07610 [Verrucomicrobia bacterium]|nr:hypothetical protein [Verrucomicrobiota bacterium]MBU4274143.1 hypothetical protein [Planctomycetota bacterium]MBU4429202.1 hypothetical protein [Verrucomicrobiota bacterium]MCG2680386.1 hypothetical protein [Kiritimatiellia bacterium]